MGSSILINIDWPWILSIIGTIISLAWILSARIKKIEEKQEHSEKMLNHFSHSINDMSRRLISIEESLRKSH
jgi:hypothetical protein